MGLPKKIGFTFKLLVSYLSVILVSFTFLGFFLDRNLEKSSLRDIESSLINQSWLVADQISPESIKEEQSFVLDALVKKTAQRLKCRLTLLNKSAKVLADSGQPLQLVSRMENHSNRPEIRLALSGMVGIDRHYSRTLKQEMLYVAVPVSEDNLVIGAVRLAVPLESVQRTLLLTRRTLLLGLGFALLFSFVLGSFLASGVIKPIKRMIQISRKYSEGDFSRRIIRYPADEIGELAQTMNKMAQDIEEKIRLIKTQSQRLFGILNSMIEGVIITDEKGRVISFNHTIETMFGVSEANSKGRLFLEAIRNNDIWGSIEKVLLTGRALSTEISLLLPVRRIFEINATPIFDHNAVSGCLVVVHDITEIRKLETMRRDFVANVSHELKTPLTSIKGFVETLLEGALEDKGHNREFLKIIEGHAERLNTLVDDLLSLAYFESKEIKLEKQEINLRHQLEEVIFGFSSQLKKKNIGIKNELSDQIKAAADKEQLDQVFTNLIDNAIKFNKENGFIRVFACEEKDAIRVTVEDSGSGIPEKDIPRIFERFYRVDKARSRQLGGTGLGLSIVKHIIELHQGSVGVESIEGLGAKFWFTLPKIN